MFKQDDGIAAAGPGSVRFPAAQLSHGQILHNGTSNAQTHTITRRRGLGDRYAVWRDGLSHKFADLDLAPDLARDIGSARWLRGVGTLVTLTALALAGWPGFSAVSAAPAMRIDDNVRDEFRSQMIMPLALGADTGRRMGMNAAVTPLTEAPERPSIDLVATLAQGDGFARMLRRAGVGDVEANQVAGMIGNAVPLADIASGTQVDITLGRRTARNQPRPLDMLSFRARFDMQLKVERAANGALTLVPHPIKVDTTPLRIRATVGQSLYRSARAAGAPPSAVQKFLRTMGSEISLDSDIGAGDEFDLIVDYKRAATGEVEAGDLLYAAVLRDGKPVKRLMRWGKEGHFFDPKGVGEQRQGMVAPVPGIILSGYGMRRHPVLGYKRMHAGLDFRAGTGTPIVAVTDGRVISAGRAGGCGNAVRLAHAGNLSTRYCHMSRMAVRPGQQVRRGQIIGYAGATGLVTGPHLHYEMYRGGRSIDPASVKFVTRAQLSGAELTNFRARLGVLESVAPGAALASIAPDPAMNEEPVREIDRIDSKQKVG